MMKKSLLNISLTGLLFFSLSTPVLANSYTGGTGWYVDFDGGSSLKTNFATASMDDTLSSLQPGDDATFTVAVKNDYKTDVDYYMRNRVLESFEDQRKVAGGGAYGYELIYVGDDGTKITLYDSKTVGGENSFQNREGLHEATDALEDYFFLDNLPSGAEGTITLKVSLDGETQGNNYQDTLAELRMEFAVELPAEPTTTKRKIRKSVNTADTANTLPYMMGLTLGGFVFLIVLLFRLRSEKEEME